MPDRAGQQIGNYRLVKLLGKGGFAEVYLGQHVRLASKQAAIKILHLFDVDIKKFQQEAETTEQLVHPHIVRLLDFDIEQGTPFLVLDFAPGGSLRTRHPKGGAVPLARVREYLKEIAPALQYAHDKHILHRDIKPDNMLIGRQGELLLSDFGIAVLTQTGRTSLSAAYGIGGTPYYMAPEAYRGRPGKESDQYALAVVVYEWICGNVPFSEGDFIQLGYQHSHEPVPPLREKNPAIPPKVEAVIMKALSKDPHRRFANVQAFATALEEACQLKLASAEASPPLEKTHLHISTVGGPCSGRTCYIQMALKEFIRVFGQEHHYALSLPDTPMNQDLQNYWRRLDAGRESHKTTDLDPPPYSVEIKRPKERISTWMYIYDAAGERFSSYGSTDFEEHYRLTNASILVIDPFCIRAYRRIHLEEIKRIQNTLRPDGIDPEGPYEWMMKMFEALFGEPGRGRYSQPLAVVLTKVDALGLENEIGGPAAKRLMAQNRFIRSEEDAISSLVRDFLSSYGLDQLVRDIESKFAKVKYFSCSALGRLPLPWNGVLPEDTSSFRPVRVMDSLVWLLTQTEFIRPMQKQE